MENPVINFQCQFTEMQLDFIGQSVVRAASQVCGDKLRDVIIYGSYALGDFHEWSDVDIMVLADTDENECRVIDDLLMRTLIELDNRMNLLLYIAVTPYDRFERMKDVYPLYRNVDREGKRLCPIPVA